jgi:PAS domain S-box-containing protein
MRGKRSPYRYRFRGRRKGGEVIHIEVDVAPILRDDKVVGTRAYLKDITEIWEMEEAVKQSEEMYRDLVEKAGIAIVIDTSDGGFKYFNQRFLDIFGYTEKEIRQLGIDDLVHPDEKKKIMQRHKDRVEGKEPANRYRFRGVRKNGQTIYLEVDAVQIVEAGEITGTRSYIWDITKRLKVEESIRKHKAMIESMRGMEKELKKTDKKSGKDRSSKKKGKPAASGKKSGKSLKKNK